MFKTVTSETLHKLQNFDTCTISNAIEQFRLRTRNEGFVNGRVHCVFPDIDPKAGYAVTARIRTTATPMNGRCYYDRSEWWSYVQTIPAPRFVVLQDVDHVPGLGALIGEVHANICIALGCTAILTNGAVRDLPGTRKTGLQLFAGNVAVSHSYAHVIDFGDPVEVGGLRINPGHLLHGDQHGVVHIPLEVADELPRVAADIVASERELIGFCHSKEFSFPTLCAKIQHMSRRLNDLDKGSE